MSFDYSGLVAASIALIDKFGRNVTFTYITPGTYTASTNAITGDSETTQTVKMAITDFRRDEIDGKKVKRGDKEALLAPDSLTREPRTGDKVTDDGKDYRVMDIDDVKPGDTVLLYKLQLRR